MATQWWNPFDGDVIPGINVRNGIRQAFTGEDLDVIEGVSTGSKGRKGQVHLSAIPDLGVRRSVPKPTGNESSGGGRNTPKLTPLATDYSGSTGGGFGGGYAPAPVDPDIALRKTLRDQIRDRGGDIEGVYKSLFGALDDLLGDRTNELESQYGDQFKQAADAYAAALPEIESSYAAIGAADSTDQTDAKGKAKTGYETTTKTIGQNKKSDLTKLGQYGKEQRAKIKADEKAARRNLGRVDETEDVDALRGMRNSLESNLDSARVTRATLGSDGAARKELEGMTKEGGRFKEATNALDSIIKSSMSGAVKEAAVKAIVDNAGLSQEEKDKVNQQYGNVYAEQAAL